jgi:F0F1-type ATP synthase membrane subunit c/vacuolar-type H+-ATPase subunit K
MLLHYTYAMSEQASSSLQPIAAAIAISISIFGAAFAQGKASSAAFEGISRNPSAGAKILVALFVTLALIESLALLSFVIANSLLK